MDYLVVSCEHGGNRIPLAYRPLFQDAESRALLASHRGYDAGALVMAEELAGHFGAPRVTATVSRLLVDLNRSVGNPHVFSPVIRALPPASRERIVAAHYRPYRDELEGLIRQRLDAGGRVIHIACHSFTPELYGEVRNADIGLLYDPSCPGEVAFCLDWQNVLMTLAPELRVRRNYPYQGKNDGFPRYLRRSLPVDRYLGIELEINQKLITRAARGWQALRAQLIASLEGLVPRSPRAAEP